MEPQLTEEEKTDQEFTLEPVEDHSDTTAESSAGCSSCACSR
ncbi:hypothetical protein [Actinomadura oligospora]|nr:hypothetical protein [Actinomadura oligospora]